MSARVLLYTKPECNYCDNIKAILVREKWEYDEKLIGRDVHRDEVFDAIGKDPTAKVTLPVVFVDGHHIGGYNELLDVIYPQAEFNDG